MLQFAMNTVEEFISFHWHSTGLETNYLQHHNFLWYKSIIKFSLHLRCHNLNNMFTKCFKDLRWSLRYILHITFRLKDHPSRRHLSHIHKQDSHKFFSSKPPCFPSLFLYYLFRPCYILPRRLCRPTSPHQLQAGRRIHSLHPENQPSCYIVAEVVISRCFERFLPVSKYLSCRSLDLPVSSHEPK